jgi:hypothetical protein
MLAMDVNDNARILDEGVVFEFFANVLAPAGWGMPKQPESLLQ